MVEIVLALAGLETLPAGRGLGGPGLDEVLKQHVHEHEHRLGLDHQRPRRLVLAGIEMLVHAVVVDDRDVARLPVVAHAVVDLVADAVEDVERRLVDVAVLLRAATGPVLLEVQMEHLRDAVLRLDVVPAPGLRAVDELDLLALAHAWHGAQPLQLVLQAVLALDGTDEDAVLLAVIVRFRAHQRFTKAFRRLRASPASPAGTAPGRSRSARPSARRRTARPSSPRNRASR